MRQSRLRVRMSDFQSDEQGSSPWTATILLYLAGVIVVAGYLWLGIGAAAQYPAQYGAVELTTEQYQAITRDHPEGQPYQTWRLGPFKTQKDCEQAARRLGVKLDCTVR